MALNYDFDIIELVAPDVTADRHQAGLLLQAGVDVLGHTCRVALFRERRTAQALRDAPAALRDCFVASGFGLTTYSSHLPRDFYPPGDEEVRLQVIERLSGNISRFALPRNAARPASDDAFCLNDFAEHVARAQPFRSVPAAPSAPAPSTLNWPMIVAAVVSFVLVATKLVVLR